MPTRTPPAVTFDVDHLLAELSNLNPHVVADRFNGDHVHIPTDIGRAITVAQGDAGEPAYLVDITTWDIDNQPSHYEFVGEHDDVQRAIEFVRTAYESEQKRIAAEDASWTGASA